ncbi:MAG TPA: hypothetical protein QGH10_00755 [Armatimonadota bacterium]|nr:hypothetical protein [Armatimonadota bacterium]
MGAVWTSWMMLMMLVGSALSIMGYLAYRATVAADDPERHEIEEVPGGIMVSNQRIPALLIVLYVTMVTGMIGYVLFVWLAKPNI